MWFPIRQCHSHLHQRVGTLRLPPLTESSDIASFSAIFLAVAMSHEALFSHRAQCIYVAGLYVPKPTSHIFVLYTALLSCRIGH